MADIRVTQIGSEEYRAEIIEGEQRRVHLVSATADDVRRLASGRTGEELVEETFRFLLERELPGRVPEMFHILVIARYHPDYLDEIPARMAARGAG